MYQLSRDICLDVVRSKNMSPTTKVIVMDLASGSGGCDEMCRIRYFRPFGLQPHRGKGISSRSKRKKEQKEEKKRKGRQPQLKHERR